MATKRKLMMLGPPGAGKGTQAQMLVEVLGVPQISTGDMLRAAKKKGSDLGKTAAGYMDRGELVPDDVVIGIVEESLKSPEVEQGFILDGFPRTVEQARALDEMGVVLDAVLNIQVSEDALIERLGERRTCVQCGATYHVRYNPTKVEGVCDRCGHDTILREDDRPESIRTRMAAYHAKTAPLIDFYRERGNLVDIDGAQTPAEVKGQIEEALELK